MTELCAEEAAKEGNLQRLEFRAEMFMQQGFDISSIIQYSCFFIVNLTQTSQEQSAH